MENCSTAHKQATKPARTAPQTVGRAQPAPTVVAMDTFAAGLSTIANGVFHVAGAANSPVAVAFAIAGMSLAWLALIEVHEMDRMGVKPDVVRH